VHAAIQAPQPGLGTILGERQEVGGRLKEKVRQAMDDPAMRHRGTAEKIAGKVQREVRDVKKVFGQ
jgi:uncharacterized protein YjbJ (UPF0337 family)